MYLHGLRKSTRMFSRSNQFPGSQQIAGVCVSVIPSLLTLTFPLLGVHSSAMIASCLDVFTSVLFNHSVHLPAVSGCACTSQLSLRLWGLWTSHQQLRADNRHVHYLHSNSLCGLVVRVPGYIMEMYCVSCEVRTKFIYVM
jgi:hypothetical protein